MDPVRFQILLDLANMLLTRTREPRLGEDPMSRSWSGNSEA